MRWAIALGGLLTVGLVRAEAPMDLDSPFPKVALIKAKTGGMEEREIVKVKKIGEGLEMETRKGSTALLPLADVLGILPRLPEGTERYGPEDVARALALLEALPAPLNQRPEASADTLQKWRDLKKPAEEAEAKREEENRRAAEDKRKKEEEMQAVQIQAWMREAGDFFKARTAQELAQVRQNGEELARAYPTQRDLVQETLAALSQVQPKEMGQPLPELSKLNEVQPRLIPDDLLGWLAGGVLIISFFGLLFGLAFFSSSLTQFKEGAWLGGVVYGIAGLVLLGVLVWTWLPAQVIGEAVPSRADPKMEELGIYLKNRAKPVYYFPAKQFSFSAEEWRSGVLGYLPVSEKSVGLFKVKMKEGELRLTEGKWIWQQPLTALGIPLPFQLTLEGPTPELQDWENPAIFKVRLGRWSLPDSIAGLLKDSASSIFQQGLASGGLAGVSLDKDGEGVISISVPAAGVRPKYELATTKKEVAYRREITAEELAKAFTENKGKEFQGKFVVIEGVVEKISSGSEYSGVSLASQGSGLNPGKAPARIREESFDIFYLRAMNSFGHRKDPLFIKLLVKSPDVFVMDSYGDIYKGPNANTVRDKPFIKKGYRVKFLKEGRVQTDQIINNEIEVYGVEISGDEDIQPYDPSSPKTE
jgi:hypothetical protein